jgi:hypothetical protein
MRTDMQGAYDPTPHSLTGTDDVISTNVYDAGAAVKLFEGFSQKPPKLCATWENTGDGGGGAGLTGQIKLVGADSANLATNPIVIADSGIFALTALEFKKFEIPVLGQSTAKRYYGVIFDQGGTTPTADVTAILAEAMQSNMLR